MKLKSMCFSKIRWSMTRHDMAYSDSVPHCNLFLDEKLQILLFLNKDKASNKHTELLPKCRHKYKFLLFNLEYK